MRNHHRTSAWFEIYLVMIGVALAVLGMVLYQKFMVSVGIRQDLVHKKTDTMTITWVSDPELVDRDLALIPHGKDQQVLGAAIPDFANGVCTIYARLPTGAHDVDALETLGHEALHCFAGQFHK